MVISTVKSLLYSICSKKVSYHVSFHIRTYLFCSEDGLNTDDEFLFADDWTQSLIEPHILWSKGDLRLMVNDEVVGTGAGRLEVRHVYYIIDLHIY